MNDILFEMLLNNNKVTNKIVVYSFVGAISIVVISKIYITLQNIENG